MKLTIEAVIDIDRSRRAIIAGNVDNVESTQFRNVVHALAQSVTEQALAAAVVGVEGGVEPVGASIAHGAGAEPLAPSQRPKRPDDPNTMRAFGDD